MSRAKTFKAAGLALAMALAAFGVSAPAQAECPDAKTFSSGAFMSDLCWDCMYPVQIAGATSGNGFPDDVARSCTCPSVLLFGTPTPGVVFGMWKPTHLVETVRQPGCFPTIGQEMDLNDSLQHGGGDRDSEQSAYHSTHVYTFPVGAILDMLTNSACTTSSSYDVDIASISEIDPTHSDPMLSMSINPEASLFANEVAQAVCIADALAASVYKPILHVFWCMGQWGNTYPLTGYANHRSPVQAAGVHGARALAIMHKRGLANLHYGDSAVCSSHPFPVIPKQQYKWQVLYPMPQRNGNDWLGRSTLLSREWRHQPIVGEDWVQVMSTYENCCIHVP